MRITFGEDKESPKSYDMSQLEDKIAEHRCGLCAAAIDAAKERAENAKRALQQREADLQDFRRWSEDSLDNWARRFSAMIQAYETTIKSIESAKSRPK